MTRTQTPAPQRRAIDPRTGRLDRVVTDVLAVRPPPEALRRARLDNLALLPASELAFKERWQQLANELPAGTTLIILPREDSPQRRALERVADSLTAHGRPVKAVSTGHRARRANA